MLELYDRFVTDPVVGRRERRASCSGRGCRRRRLAASAGRRVRGRRWPRVSDIRIGVAARSTSRSRFAATVTSPPRSIRSAAGRRGDPLLQPEDHGVTDADLLRLAAGDAHRRTGRGRRDVDVRRGRDAARRSTARRPATTSRTSSCPRSGGGCAKPSRPALYRAPNDPIDPVALLDRLTRRRGRSSGSCTAPFRARRVSRSKALDMLVPILDEVISEAAKPGCGRRSSAWRTAAG